MSASTEPSAWWSVYKVAIGVGGLVGAVYGAGRYRPRNHPVLECAAFVRDTFIGAGIGCLYVATFPVSTLVAEAIERVPGSSPPSSPSAAKRKSDTLPATTQETTPQDDATTDDKTGDSGMDVVF